MLDFQVGPGGGRGGRGRRGGRGEGRKEGVPALSPDRVHLFPYFGTSCLLPPPPTFTSGPVSRAASMSMLGVEA